MRVRCKLRELRGDRSLRELARATGINHGRLSEIEHGHLLPRDDQLEQLERAYDAPRHTWYPDHQLLQFEHDEEAP